MRRKFMNLQLFADGGEGGSGTQGGNDGTGSTVICYLVAMALQVTAVDNKRLPVICGAAVAVFREGFFKNWRKL